MRIRKHAQRFQTCCLPSQLPSPNPCPRGSPPRICELNRSPWDVMSFIPEAMREDGVSGDESREETSSAVGSISSSKETWGEDDGKLKLEGSSDISMKSKPRKEGRFICCNKTDGKGWQCKKEAKRWHSLCDHHLAQLKSYYTNNKGLKSGGAPSAAAAAVANNVHRGKRLSSSKKMSSSSNYYYYTGFGPLWGKGKGRGEDMKVEVDSGPSSSNPSLSSRGDADDADNDDDDVEDEDSGGDDVGNFDKKKSRKPVKTRSLKSLF